MYYLNCPFACCASNLAQSSFVHSDTGFGLSSSSLLEPHTSQRCLALDSLSWFVNPYFTTISSIAESSVAAIFLIAHSNCLRSGFADSKDCRVWSSCCDFVNHLSFCSTRLSTVSFFTNHFSSRYLSTSSSSPDG